MAIQGLVSDTFEEVSDPSDWSESKFPKLADLDSYLRCQICKDFLKAPVLTTCGHVFCSICIRRSITESNKCPACLEETYESGLRKVLLLDNIVRWFSHNRDELLNKLELEHINDSQEQEMLDISENIYSMSKNDKRDDRPNDVIPRDISSDPIHKEISSDPPTEKVENGVLAECPICGVFMPLTEIQGSHIDQCLASGAGEKCQKITQNQSSPNCQKPVQPKSLTSFFGKLDNNSLTDNAQLQPESVRAKQRLANLDTSISTSKLKEKLTSLHLPLNGSRAQMEQRMKEYINLYNANLDSINPVSDRVLVDRLQKWEALVNNKPKNGGVSNNNTRTTSSPPINYDEPTIKRQKIQHEEWNTKNNDQYVELIKRAKANMKKQKNKAKLENDNNDKPKQESFSDHNKELRL